MNHIHHIVPRHMGGGDEEENLISLSISEHAEAHRLLYEKHGFKEDWLAWKCLDGSIDKEQIILERCSLGGKKGQSTLRKLKKCSFYNEDLRGRARQKSIESSKLAKAGFHNPEVQRELGKRGGPKNKGFVWLTDGVTNIKYSPKLQKEKSVQDFLASNSSFRVGRTNTQTTAVCPQCGISDRKCTITRYHLDNCGKHRSFKIAPTRCPHCGKEGAGGSMKRWHFDNCKERRDEG